MLNNKYCFNSLKYVLKFPTEIGTLCMKQTFVFPLSRTGLTRKYLLLPALTSLSPEYRQNINPTQGENGHRVPLLLPR